MVITNNVLLIIIMNTNDVDGNSTYIILVTRYHDIKLDLALDEGLASEGDEFAAFYGGKRLKKEIKALALHQNLKWLKPWLQLR